MKKIKFKRSIKIIFVIIAFAAIMTYYYFEDPAVQPYPPCPFYFITGLYCPGCGSSRALHQLLHGNFLKALDYNPLMVISIPFVIYLFLSQYQIELFGRRVARRVLFNKTFYTLLLIIIFVYWVIRNIPCYPFTVLAP